MAKAPLKLVSPTTVKRTVTPKRPPNADLRTREYLTEAEVERLMGAAKDNRHGQRDAAIILVAYRHGLRAAELVDLRWDQAGFNTATLHVRRSSMALPARIPSSVTNFVPFGGSIANKRPSHHLYSRRNGEHHSRPQASPERSSAQAPKPG
jgi:integrase